VSIRRFLLLFLLLTPLALLHSQATGVARAGWLAGCWERRATNRVTLEMWMPALGDLMLGASRTTVGAATAEFEQLRLKAEGDRLVYTALPSGQREASFPSITVSDTLLVFENTAHDFPQRISYRRRGADSVIAQIEGPGPNGTRRIQFPMRRASCTTMAPPAPPDTVILTADLSPDRRHLLVARGAAPDIDVYLHDAGGQVIRRLTELPNFDYQPRWSPDGQRIAFAGVRGRQQQIYTMKADGSDVVELTSGSQNSEPAWSPDGRLIAFRSERDGNANIFVMNADGSGQRGLTTDARAETSPAWSPDGRRLLFTAPVGGHSEIHVVNVDGSGMRQLTQTAAGHSRIAYWSPDGKLIAFGTNRDGNDEVYVMAADGSGAKNISNHTSSEFPVGWSSDASEILFISTRDRAARDVYRMKADGSSVVRLTVTR
jgi:dipeptidyl aminopeptidase/acylaminoacyl peptidase